MEISIIIFGLAFLYLVAAYISIRIRLGQMAIKGSYQRYVSTTRLIILVTIRIIISLTAALLNTVRGGSTLETSLQVICFLLSAWELWGLLCGDDDSWFHKQWKRLKQGLKNLQSSLRLKPVPNFT